MYVTAVGRVKNRRTLALVEKVERPLIISTTRN